MSRNLLISDQSCALIYSDEDHQLLFLAPADNTIVKDIAAVLSILQFKLLDPAFRQWLIEDYTGPQTKH